ncbi:phosphatase PAP2 family protein [Galactobacter caseinivorans]|uniref:PAP2 family protein n=1 Tax=Galactobacter caseinivorans TaxID=2676123 RepID=A0A496PLJ3_9MICC|nr:phosphatase PAP2 family protein [Galactobacter caseinivorans]RKW71395.1 PAP2 family protein [Galactobacter caseinivorans]
MISPSTDQIPVTAHPPAATDRGATADGAPADGAPVDGATGLGVAGRPSRDPLPGRDLLTTGAKQRGPRWWAWLLPIGALVGVAALYALFILTVRGQWVDERSLEGALKSAWGQYQRNQAQVSLDVLPLAVGLIGAAGVLISAVVRRQVVVPLIAVAGGGAAMLATQFLKHDFLTRPDLGVSAANMNSFPSGHSTAAAAAVLALLLAAPRAARPWIAMLGSVLAGVAGAGTLVMGWHRPSDIVGAFLVVALCGVAAGWGVALRERSLAKARALRGLAPRRMDARPGMLARGASLTLAILGLAAVVVCAVLLIPQLRSPGTEDAPSLQWFFMVGLTLCLAAACCVFPLLERWVDSLPRDPAAGAAPTS